MEKVLDTYPNSSSENLQHGNQEAYYARVLHLVVVWKDDIAQPNKP
jgi:hypothetical protein